MRRALILSLFVSLYLHVAAHGETNVTDPRAQTTTETGSLSSKLARSQSSAMSPGQTFRDCGDCPEMVVVPAGQFVMGSPKTERGRDLDEGPQRKVTFAAPFAVGKYEVTFTEWDACVADGGCESRPDEGWGRGTRPVINLYWEDIAAEYLPWLSKKTGRPYRLLTEAEWEYVARGDSKGKTPLTKPYWWGLKAARDRANYGKDPCCGPFKDELDPWETSAPVGQFPANPFGLYDMHGNVWEWVQDCYKPTYAGSPRDGRAVNKDRCLAYVLRGGSFYVPGEHIRVANRLAFKHGLRLANLGFRVALTLAP